MPYQQGLLSVTMSLLDVVLFLVLVIILSFTVLYWVVYDQYKQLQQQV